MTGGTRGEFPHKQRVEEIQENLEMRGKRIGKLGQPDKRPCQETVALV